MPTAHLISCLVVNSLTLLFGIILLITASIFVTNTDYIQQICPQIYIVSILSIVTGASTALLAGALIIFITKQFPSLTTVFSCLLIIVILLATACAIFLLIIRSTLQTTTLNKTITIFNNYSDSNNIPNSKNIVQQIQQSFECCGVQASTDWKNKISNQTIIPDSCCHYITDNCGKNTHSSNNDIYHDGCAQPIYEYFEKMSTTLIGMNFCAAILAISTCVVSLYLRQFMRYRYQSF